MRSAAIRTALGAVTCAIALVCGYAVAGIARRFLPEFAEAEAGAPVLVSALMGVVLMLTAAAFVVTAAAFVVAMLILCRVVGEVVVGLAEWAGLADPYNPGREPRR